MRAKLLATALLAVGLIGVTACANTDTDTGDGDPGDQDPYGTAGLALSSDFLADTDIEAMRFGIQRVDCESGESMDFTDTRTTDLSDVQLPGGIPSFEGEPYSGDSQHIIADQFFLVDAGCYDVTTTPLQADEQPSDDCSPATEERVAVEDSATTEILLVNQCKGASRGGLDVIGSVNHPPEVDNLEFTTSKFLSSCEAQNEVCLTVSDADDDPVEVEWSAAGSGTFTGDISPVQPAQQQPDGTWESCARLATNRPGDYTFRATVYDLDGSGERIESILANQDDPADAPKATSSNDVLNFPVYSGVACQGRTATMLMAMSNSPGPSDAGLAEPFIRQTAAWAAPISQSVDNRVLYVLDNSADDEHIGDDTFVIDALQREEVDNRFPNVDRIDEPAEGITMSAVEGYDLVWFANPGLPLDDATTYDTLQQFLQEGGGVIMQGDDMAGPPIDEERSLSFFTGLEWIDNGTTTCGDTTDGNVGNNYTVTYSQEPVSALEGLRGQSFEYGNDIDHTAQVGQGERILATATYQSGECQETYPAAVAFSPVERLLADDSDQ